MATSTTKVTKPSFINTNAKIAGKQNIQDTLDLLKEFEASTKEMAQTALTANDRKGVLLAMKVAGIAARGVKGLENAIKRASRYRLTKDEKASFEKDGTLPAGIEQVVIEADEEDEDDDQD